MSELSERTFWKTSIGVRAHDPGQQRTIALHKKMWPDQICTLSNFERLKPSYVGDTADSVVLFFCLFFHSRDELREMATFSTELTHSHSNLLTALVSLVFH